MDARLFRVALGAVSLLAFLTPDCPAASVRTQNFIVTGASADWAQQVAQAAENFRRDLAVEWLGEPLPPWQDICPIRVHDGPQLGAGGVTSFSFRGGRPFDWSMTIQGSRERILDSVLPHEITHTIFATHFGRPLPRWADEGACTTVEHSVEKQKHHQMLYEFLTTSRGIAFNDMFAMSEYPGDILPLYAQGFSLARFLIEQGGKRKFVDYVGEGMETRSWTAATQRHYQFASLSDLQVTWLDWVRQGCPPLEPSARPAERETIQLAQAQSPGADLSSPSTALSASPGEPRPFPAAEDAEPIGWYHRTRDQAAQSLAASSAIANTAATVNTTVPEMAAAPRAVSRPQPAAGPRQIVVEWTNPHPLPGPAVYPTSLPPSASIAPRPTANSLSAPRSIWR